MWCLYFHEQLKMLYISYSPFSVFVRTQEHTVFILSWTAKNVIHIIFPFQCIGENPRTYGVCTFINIWKMWSISYSPFSVFDRTQEHMVFILPWTAEKCYTYHILLSVYFFRTQEPMVFIPSWTAEKWAKKYQYFFSFYFFVKHLSFMGCFHWTSTTLGN